MTEVCQSLVPISKKFADNKAECNLKHWTFSPRMSHYHVLIMLISQPLESCPAFHCQRRVERMIVVGGCAQPTERLGHLFQVVWSMEDSALLLK